MTDLYETTIQLIRSSELKLSDIASGAKVGKRWLAGLLAGRYSDPGVKKIQRLYDFLTAQSGTANRRHKTDRRASRRKTGVSA